MVASGTRPESLPLKSELANVTPPHEKYEVKQEPSDEQRGYGDAGDQNGSEGAARQLDTGFPPFLPPLFRPRAGIIIRIDAMGRLHGSSPSLARWKWLLIEIGRDRSRILSGEVVGNVQHRRTFSIPPAEHFHLNFDVVLVLPGQIWNGGRFAGAVWSVTADARLDAVPGVTPQCALLPECAES